MWPSLRTIGGEPTHRCRSDAPASTIAWNSASIALRLAHDSDTSLTSTMWATLTMSVVSLVSM